MTKDRVRFFAATADQTGRHSLGAVAVDRVTTGNRPTIRGMSGTEDARSMLHGRRGA